VGISYRLARLHVDSAGYEAFPRQHFLKMGLLKA